MQMLVWFYDVKRLLKIIYLINISTNIEHNNISILSIALLHSAYKKANKMCGD